MTAETRLPSYLPYPRFLLKTQLSMSAQLVYAVLLGRATLSQANNWSDDNDRLYLIFPIASLADAIRRSKTTVKRALNELEAAGLIERRHNGLSAPNHIYVKLPDGMARAAAEGGKCPLTETGIGPCEGPFPVHPGDRKRTLTGAENEPSEGPEMVHPEDRKRPPNNLNKSNKKSKKERVKTAARAVYGRYQNVLLTETEVSELQTELPAVWQEYVEKLSAFIASTGRQYRSYAATIRRWVQKDRQSTTRSYHATEEDLV